jgi:hypothetical protein
MIDGIIFGAIILVVIAITLIFGVGIKKIVPWAETKDGIGAIASMILGVVVVVVVGILVTLATSFFNEAKAQSVLDNKYGHFFNNVYVYAGIDYTKKVSPQCVAGSINDHLTSNMGFGTNVWQSPSRKVHLDLTYTHHSCVIGVDRNSYDAFGLRTTWYPWVRNPSLYQFTYNNPYYPHH